MDLKELKEKMNHLENHISHMKEDLKSVSEYSKFPISRSIESLEYELQEVRELISMIERRKENKVELSRGFQSYILRNINKVKDYPLFETLDLSMDGDELDIFLIDIERMYGVECIKTIGVNHILITISKRW